MLLIKQISLIHFVSNISKKKRSISLWCALCRKTISHYFIICEDGPLWYTVHIRDIPQSVDEIGHNSVIVFHAELCVVELADRLWCSSRALALLCQHAPMFRTLVMLSLLFTAKQLGCKKKRVKKEKNISLPHSCWPNISPSSSLSIFFYSCLYPCGLSFSFSTSILQELWECSMNVPPTRDIPGATETHTLMATAEKQCLKAG